MAQARHFRTFAKYLAAGAATAVAVPAVAHSTGFFNASNDTSASASSQVSKYPPLASPAAPPPSRDDMIAKLESEPEFDVVIVGGGATGSGIALDAASRGLKVALLERDDFAAGTSSKSTKMAHGGVRYLEKAVLHLDKAQLDLVIEALHERHTMLQVAPHLTSVLPIFIPIYKYWQLPYMYVGCKMYDIFAGKYLLRPSYAVSSSRAAALFPMLRTDGLVGGVVYHDGSFNDSRMNASLALTAVKEGATVLTHMTVTGLGKGPDGKVREVTAEDAETGKNLTIKTKTVVNATGPYADALLALDEPALATDASKKLVVPSSGTHLVLPEYFGNPEVGLLDPETSDGRMLFYLPWQGKTLVGTTDTALPAVPEQPVPTSDDVDFILDSVKEYLAIDVSRADVLSAWTGIRPLVRDLSKPVKPGDTQELVRNHLITFSDSGMLTISGGKWTTYREMAQEAVDSLLARNPELATGKQLKPCSTTNLQLIGAEGYHPNFNVQLAQAFNIPGALAAHLAHNYGTRAPTILKMMEENAELSQQLHPEYPFTLAELLYSIRYEYALSSVDFLTRRCRLAFLDARAALSCVDTVVDVMGRELHWSSARKAAEKEKAEKYIGTMVVEA